MFLTAEEARRAKNIWVTMEVMLVVIGFIKLESPAWVIVPIVCLLVPITWMIFKLINRFTPARRTSELQKLLPSPTFWDNLYATSGAAKSSDGFCAEVMRHYRQNEETANLPFPLGLAHADLCGWKQHAQDAASQIADTMRKWKGDEQQEKIWKQMADSTAASLQKIKQWLDLIEAHPRFQVDYQSWQAYKVCQTAANAERIAEEALWNARMA